MRIAVVTGASSGLGREYALSADREGTYDEIWAIARRAERLQELAAKCTTPVRAVCLDLADKSAAQELKSDLEQADCEVGLLVNAAGLGKFGTWESLTQGEVDAMIDVNCRALVDVTQACLPHMGRGGRIIQVASSASFQPLPGMNVYAASKAFVRSYTRALRWELLGRGIYVTAVCPLWVKTEFISVARETADGQAVRHPRPQLTARHVVRWSRFVNRCNYPIATCDLIAFLMRVCGKIVPAPVIMAIWQAVRRV